MTDTTTTKFLEAMHHVYGNFIGQSATALMTWKPLPSPDGHRGRYLWTDAFGVCNFLTLFNITQDERYLTLAERLIVTVHNVLGYTRDGTARLPGASDVNPLGGGLRIGKLHAEGRDGDGQYYHYLTMWMFALNRMAKASGDNNYNDHAIQLVKAIHNRFVHQREGERPRMVWKMSSDLCKVLVPSEGSLDPIQGYVVYHLIQEVAKDPKVLYKEMEELKMIFHHKYDYYTSNDPLDLGMALWSVHGFAKGFVKEPWALNIQTRSLKCIGILFEDNYFNGSMNPLSYRLAFREFGTAMGIKCSCPVSQPNSEPDTTGQLWKSRADSIIDEWEKAGTISLSDNDGLRPNEHSAITHVMYCAALIPGVFEVSVK